MLRELFLALEVLGLDLCELALEPGLLSIKPLSIIRVHVGCRLAGRIPISMGRGEGKRGLIHLELQLLDLSGCRGKLGIQQCLGRPLALERGLGRGGLRSCMLQLLPCPLLGLALRSRRGIKLPAEAVDCPLLNGASRAWLR